MFSGRLRSNPPMSPIPRLILRVVSVIALGVAVPALAASGDDAAPVLAEGERTAASLTGTLVSRESMELVVRDAGGSEHRFRLNEQTRYVWGEQQNPKDLVPGATIRADYQFLGTAPVATYIWLVAPRS